ncbi:MAG TPA: hypothetical protein VIB62_06780 [Actinomycetota bacterium]|jgi:hypothetical protein
MAILRRVLKLQAVLWAAFGLVLLAVPGLLLEEVFEVEEGPGDVWLRMAGVMGVVLAMLMVLVAQRVLDVWWWTWAFAILEAGVATLAILEAVSGDPPSWPWWALGGSAVLFLLLDLIGLARAERERPFA